MFKVDVPEKIRVSLGSAIVIGLLDGKLDAAPTTAYILTYRNGKCIANCGFCPQARESKSRTDMLSRVSWPVFPTARVFEGIKKAVKKGLIKRVCFQALNYPKVFFHLMALVKNLRLKVNVPISVSCQPLNEENIRMLASAGVERISISLDAATEEIFDRVKGRKAGGPYVWKEEFRLLKEAVKILGKGKVTTHLIVGLGETEEEMIKTIQKCVDVGVLPALFAFTPIPGTALEKNSPPTIQQYRRVQIARYLIFKGISRYEQMSFSTDGHVKDFGVKREDLLRIVQTGEPFLTSGCPNCNRPYYNERPGGPIYNFPRPLREDEKTTAMIELGIK